MTAPRLAGPRLAAGIWTWSARRGDVEVRFTGRGSAGDRDAVLQAVAPGAPPVAWARQVHSAVALPARPGCCGEGDALFGGEAGLALSVMTADCVPILVSAPRRLAAIHAGWRGLAGGVIAAALDKLQGPPGEWAAWVGPAIGACCYEVGEDVADQVVAASGAQVAVRGPSGRPHLDLAGATRLQLAAAGVGEVVVLRRCTRCHEDKLWSYRRKGRAAGRNLGFIWKVPS